MRLVVREAPGLKKRSPHPTPLTARSGTRSYSAFARLAAGIAAGVVLIALLAAGVYLLSWGVRPAAGPLVVLSWPVALAAGWLSGMVSGRSEIPVAALSALVGGTAPVVLHGDVPFHAYALLCGGPYVAFAVLGGLAAATVRQDYFENERNGKRPRGPEEPARVRKSQQETAR